MTLLRSKARTITFGKMDKKENASFTESALIQTYARAATNSPFWTGARDYQEKRARSYERRDTDPVREAEKEKQCR